MADYEADDPHESEPASVWSSREYRIYAPSWLLTVLAAQVETVVLGIYVYGKTADPLSLGWIGLAKAVPMILLALAGGHLADRFNRQWLLVLTVMGQALCGLALATVAYYQLALWWVYTILVIEAATQALGTPARAALIPLLVSQRQFSRAVAWNSSIFQLGTMIGPAVGGILLGRTNNYALVLGLVGIVRILAVMGFLLMRPRKQEFVPAHEAAGKDIWEGLKFVWKHKSILGAISLDLFAVLLGGVTYILPIFAEDILKVGPEGLGFLRSAEALGAITMAMILAHLPPMQHAGRNMLLAVTGFGLATIVFGLSKSFWLSLAMMFLIGALDNISVVVRHTLVQMLTPDRMRGRVSAVNSIFIVISNDLGGLESGVTARLLGAVGSAILGGTGAIIAVLIAMKLWPDLAKIGRLDDIRTVEHDLVPGDQRVSTAPSVEPGDLVQSVTTGSSCDR